MQEKNDRPTNRAGLTAEEAYLMAKFLLGRKNQIECEFERRKKDWEKEHNKMWSEMCECDGDDFVDRMMEIQIKRKRQIDIAVTALDEKVMGFKRVMRPSKQVED